MHLHISNLTKISLSHSVSKINAIFKQKFKMVTEKGSRNKSETDASGHTLQTKYMVKIAPSCTISEINMVLYFTKSLYLVLFTR